MSGNVPQMDMGLTPAGQPVVIVGEAAEEAQDMAALLRLAPGIALPGHASDAALLANHLAHGVQYSVITDPGAFEREYRARLAREDPAAPWQEHRQRLRDFGVPAFGEIKPPRFEAGQLVFFAADSFLGVPYRVLVPELAGASEYTPLPLAPVPAAAADERPPTGAVKPPLVSPNPPRTIRPATPEELAARRSHKPGERRPPAEGGTTEEAK